MKTKTYSIKDNFIILKPVPPKNRGGLRVYLERKPVPDCLVSNYHNCPVATTNIKGKKYTLPDRDMVIVRLETKEKNNRWCVRSLVI